jgi:RNA polymerase sigma-70 factor (ECF subfamily)
MTTPESEFERMVIEHLDGLYNLARWLTRNTDEAQDLVQETALKALRARDQFRGGTTLTAWLYSILRNSFIDRYWKRHREPSGQGGSLTGVLGELEQALEETEIERLRPLVAADINRALEALPEQWRTTVLLAEVEGLTWEEVAEVMGCPLGTVQSRIFRARRVLRQLLKDYGPERKGGI